MNGENTVKPESIVLSPIRVVIADPDESLLALYRESLREGFEVVTTSSASECVARMRERVPDVLLLELQLPRGESIERLLPQLPELLDFAAEDELVRSVSEQGMYLPTRDEIRRQCSEIRRRWSPTEKVKRWRGHLANRQHE